MKSYLILILTILSFDTFSCDCYDWDLDKFIKEADYVFIGEAIRNISPDPHLSDSLDRDGDGSTVDFKIIKAVKGILTNELIVIDQREALSCTQSFRFGEQYLVFGFDDIPSMMMPRDKNMEYLMKNLYSGVSEVTLDKKAEQFEKFFDDLREMRVCINTNGCAIFDSKSEKYNKIKEYSR